MRSRLPNSKSMLVLIAAGMIMATMLLSVIMWFKLSRSIELRNGLREQFIEWEQLLSMLKDAETGQRGFLITGQEEYLVPFNQAVSDLPKQLQSIARLGQKDRAEISDEELVRINRLVDKRLEILREGLVVRRREGYDAAATLIQQGEGKKVMDDIRTMFNERLVRLEDRISTVTNAMKTDLLWGFYSMLGTSIVSLLSGSAAWFMLRESEAQARREERLAAEKRRAEEADREKSTFLATMSHEIRTPMNAILGFGELLLDEVATDKERRYAQCIVRSGNSLLQIINDILDLSKIEAGMMDIHRESTDVREVAAFVQQLFLNQAVTRNVELRADVDDSVPTSLMLDGARLRQILINLAGNALKFTETGHVTMRFRGQRGGETSSRFHLIVEVEDTGVGIPQDKLHDIFKPFVQARAKRDVEMRGTGLGLAIVKRLTELMHGSVMAESVPGRGSTFRVSFHDVEISARLPQGMMPDEPEVDFNDLRPSHILVVDDNPVNRELVRGFFEKTHHRVSEAADGREAISFIEKDRPDIVLMDIRMPVLDGRTALKEMRSRRGLDLLPVIAVTASSMAGEEGALRESFNGYVRKPYSRAQLYKEIAQFIPLVPMEEKQRDEKASADTPASEEWRVLLPKLRQIEASTWHAVCDGMVISEVQRFASTLGSLGGAHACPPLMDYAARMEAQASDFALSELEKTLARFPALISEWEQRLNSPA